MRRLAALAALVVGVLLAGGCADRAAVDPAPLATSDAPWDDGFAREWFFTRKRAHDDPLWERSTHLVGAPLPPLDVGDWRHGDPVDLADLRGRVVLVDFWATWCPDCRKAAPVVEALTERLADEPLTVVSICASKGGERYDEAIADWGLSLPTALDATGATERAYDVLRWPYFVLADADGIVRASGIITKHLDEAVDLLLERERARGALAGS